MIFSLFKLLAGRPYKKFLRRVEPIVKKINRFEEEYRHLTDEQLRAKTGEFKVRLREGETLDEILPEAFAAVKNAARRLCGQVVIVCEHELIWDMVHYDVQLIGGIALHEGKIAEMGTGEGKTLVATLPLYLNALTGKNCQLVTVNDYLVRRDAQWMGYLYEALGLTVGYIQMGMDSDERQQAYACDITYGTSSEFGFDYLRDNGMATRKQDQVQRDHYYCIVDEVDSILIDEARTPLIISGPVKIEREAPYVEYKSGVDKLVREQQRVCNKWVNDAKVELEKPEGGKNEEALRLLLKVRMGMPKNRILLRLMENGTFRKILDRFEIEMNGEFRKEDLYHLKEELYFVIDEKQHLADLTERGRNLLRPGDADAFVMPDLPSMFVEIDGHHDWSNDQKQKAKQDAEEHFLKASEEIHCLSQLLRAYCLYDRDVEYVVQDGKVIIVDEHTGRLMPGRRWSEGLHQAVEAKESVAIQEETKTFATITIQNYFRLYEKLSGMTGTAETEAMEFYDIYKLDVMPIPTHKKCIRVDANDIIFKTRREKYSAVIDEIKQAHDRGQPVLVGTASVDSSEVLHRMLQRVNIPHNVLNAKYHEQEAEIVARAGQRGAVTIATNMAGRGTDIKLGEGVAGLGGLYVIGTERHESRRVDRQLRGRCSRQGDPGMSRFYVSLEDDLMRLFANSGPISRILESTFKEGEQLEHPLLNRSIESAQKKVEQHHYSIRKRLLKYDDVLNQQREVVYGVRNDAIHSDDPSEIVFEMVADELQSRIDGYGLKYGMIDENEVDGFARWLNSHFPLSIKASDLSKISVETMREELMKRIKGAYGSRKSVEEPIMLKQIERYVVVRPIDENWQDHLTEMEELRRSVGLRSYGQKDPLNEYKSDAFTFFVEMMNRIRHDIATGLFRSVTGLDRFNNMLDELGRRARIEGPGEDGEPVVMVGSVSSSRKPGPVIQLRSKSDKKKR